MITVSNLRKVYGQGAKTLVALDDISLHVPQGEIFGVLGQSGAGKSTLIRCINLLERPTSGAITVAGQEITQLSAAALRQARQQIGMVFQHFNLLSSRTVAENIAFPLEIMNYSKTARAARVKELLALVGLEGKANAYPAQLSGGQKQRVGIARALAGEPKVLLSDEATSALDPETTRSILELLSKLNREMGLTILLITHEMNVVKQICQRVAILKAGQIVEQGYVAELAQQHASLLAKELFPQVGAKIARPGTQIVTLSFGSKTAEQAIISKLVRDFNLEITILAGSIETIGNQRVGQLQLELSGTAEALAGGLAYLQHEVNYELV